MAARQRFIHPDFWTDPTIGQLSLTERLLFIGCFSNADDEGRLLGNAAFLRSTIFPYDDLTIDQVSQMRDRIVAVCKNIVLYVVDGVEYLAFTKWSAYQKPKYAKPSKCPAPLDANTVETFPQNSGKAPEDLEEDFLPRLGLGLDIDRVGLDKDIVRTVEPEGPTITKPREQTSKFGPGDTPYELAAHLRATILNRDPNTKVPDETPEALAKWALDANRLINIDKRDPTEAARLMEWAQSDNFWQSNILSMAKFREKYDTLKRQSQARPRGQPKTQETAVDRRLREMGVPFNGR